MKKTSSIFFCFVSLFITAVLSCTTGEWTPPKEDPYYREVKTTSITYNEEDGDPDLYMFVYNIGEKTIPAKEYENIIKLNHAAIRAAFEEDENFTFESLENQKEDFSKYTCGLSLETVRRAGKNFRVKRIPQKNSKTPKARSAFSKRTGTDTDGENAATSTGDGGSENNNNDDGKDDNNGDNSDDNNNSSGDNSGDTGSENGENNGNTSGETGDNSGNDENNGNGENSADGDSENENTGDGTDTGTGDNADNDTDSTGTDAEGTDTDSENTDTEDESDTDDENDDDDEEEEKKYDRSLFKEAAKIGDDADFYTIYSDESGESIAIVNAVCVYANDVCQIFVEDGWYDDDGYHENNYYADDASVNSYVQDDPDDYKTIRVTSKGVKLIADSFSKMHAPEQAVFGKANLDFIKSDDSNIIETSEKITILISNLGKKKSGSATLGYFYPEDLRCDCDDYGLIEVDEYTTYYTNQRLMFTINTLGFSRKFGGENAIISTLAHEFNHMLNFINKTLKHSKNGNLSYETWFTEMLSLIAEDFMADIAGFPNTVQKQRLPYFLRYPYRGMVNWQNDIDNSYYYGFAYAFGAYLVRNYGGIKTVNAMATNSYSDGKYSISYAIGGLSSYEKALKNFGLIYVNADGTKTSVDEYDNPKSYPTLNKAVSEKFKDINYKFSAIDLYSFDSRNSRTEEVSRFKIYYSNPKWTSESTTGPCFYNSPPDNIYAGGFYAVYLGKASDYDYKLTLNPPRSYGDLQAYIFAEY